MQLGMIFNGVFKIPMKFFILFIGVMVFVFYQFNPSPINFNPQGKEVIFNTVYQNEYIELKESLEDNFKEKTLVVNEFLISESQELKDKINNLSEQEQYLRDRAKILIGKAAELKKQKIESNDKDYVFIHFILENLPKGLIGLLLAVIISAAMSSTSSELNALATTTTVDILKRNFDHVDDKNIVYYTKLMTLFWGLCAITIACFAYLADNLIQLVNIIGSIFYGNVLGIFLIAFFLNKIKSNAVFSGAIITQAIIIIAWFYDWMPFLWLNVFGCTLVILISYLINTIIKKN